MVNAWDQQVLRDHHSDVFDEPDPPHIHVEHQGNKAVFDLSGNITRGNPK